jgi:hypothetical protein
MPDAINITDIRHLPESGILLIDYNITQPGRWNIYEAYSGYRDLFTNFWTILVPETNDPRHTNLPVTVAAGTLFQGTFVWRYSSIRGVNSENFSNNKSYYIQLAIFTRGPGDIVIDPPIDPTRNPAYLPPLVTQVLPPDVSDFKTPPNDLPGDPPIPPRVPPVPAALPKPRPPDPPADPRGPGGRNPTVGPKPPPPPDRPTIPGRNPIVIKYPPGIGPAIPDPRDRTPVTLPPRPLGGLLIKPDLPGLGIPQDPYQGGIGQSEPGEVQATDPNVIDSGGYLAQSDDNSTLLIPGGIVDLPVINGDLSYPGDDAYIDPGDIIPGDVSIISVVVNGDGSTAVVDPGDPVDPADISISTQALSPEVPDIITEPDRPDLSITRPRTYEITQSIVDTQNPIRIVKPSIDALPSDLVSPGGGPPNRGEVPPPVDPNSFQTIKGRTAATSAERNSLPNQRSRSKDIDRVSIQFTEGVEEGYISKYNYKEKARAGITKKLTLEKINAANLLPGVTVSLQIPVEDVPKGESIFASAIFTPPTGLEVEAVLQLWTIDSQGRTILLDYTDLILSSKTNPISLAYSVASYNFDLGPITIVAIARDKTGRVIGVSSKKAVVRPPLVKLGTDSNLRIREPRNITTAAGLPAYIVDRVNLDKPPLTLYVKDSKPVRLLLNKIEKSENKFSAVLVGPGLNSIPNYKIDVYSMTEGYPISPGEVIEIIDLKVGKYQKVTVINNIKLFSSTERLKANQEELYPNSHIVGIDNLSTDQKQLLVIIGPQSLVSIKGNRKFDLYLGASYDLKGFTPNNVKVSNSRHTIRGSCPYVEETLGLILHGKDPNSIPESYSIQYSTTNNVGEYNWPGVYIERDEYYSIILPRYDQFNAYNGIVFKDKI